MSTWVYEPSCEQLLEIPQAQDAFRKTWQSYEWMFPAAFDGQPEDVRAVDYLEYEGLPFPKCGIEGAALVCGEVVRKAADLKWMIDYRGDWVIFADHRIALNPLTRLLEIQAAGATQFNQYARFVARAAMECAWVMDLANPQLLALIELDSYNAGLFKHSIAYGKALSSKK